MIGAIIARKAVDKAFRALSNHDLAGFMSAWREDGVLIYPGEIWASGTFTGKPAVEEWCRKFFEQYPKIRFDIQQICAANIFAMNGTNVIAAHWNISLTNRTGRVGENSGVSVIRLESGKVVQVKDFVFDLGENFRLNWGA
ncbi:MAG: nuclear transport factor 2 family protein [Bacteroidota bacterium]|jgi:ketosteroid isomerase-like protein